MGCAFTDDQIAATIAFHGHSCPGLAIGIRAAELAFSKLGSADSIELVAISETDMCGVDAIQFLTDCTYGKGNFLHWDYGKKAFSFFDRKSGKGFRAVFNQAALEGMEEDRDAVTASLMEQDIEALFSLTWLEDLAPRPAQILESLTCDTCGESVMESRTRRYAGKTHCIPCFGKVEQKI